MDWLVKLLIMAGVSYGLAVYLDGIEFVSFKSAVIFTIVLSLLNVSIKPILDVLCIPYNFCYFLVFFHWLSIGFVVFISCKITEGVVVDGFLSACIFSVLLSLVTSVVNHLR